MKKGKMLLLVLSSSLLFFSCAGVKTPLIGLIYTDVKAPVAVTSNSGASKVGTAEAFSVLGLVAVGDASIDAATKSAGITKIHHVDERSMGILGIYSNYKVFVYGE